MTAIGARSLRATPFLESEYLIYLHFTDKLDKESLRKAANYVRAKVLPEGGVAIYPPGRFDMSASVKAYMILKWAGDSLDTPHMAKTRKAILSPRRDHKVQHVLQDLPCDDRALSVGRLPGNSARTDSATKVVQL